MATQCNAEQMEFLPLRGRKVVADFSAGAVTSDAGGLLLREVSEASGLVRDLAECFTDHRDPELIEHTVAELLGQRVFALALGYEDINDHEALRHDPLLATLVGKIEPNRMEGRRKDQALLAGKSTLNRLELTAPDATPAERYKKIVCNEDKVSALFVQKFVASHEASPEAITIDFDATDDPIHGEQEGRFFHGYYGEYCYLPLYAFCGRYPLLAKLRASNLDASAGTKEELERIVGQIREHWPEVKITLRADSGFARDEIMSWCEENRVDYVLGLARNPRLERAIARDLEKVRRKHLRHQKAARRYRELTYRTLASWSRKRRVVAKAEHLEKGPNPRFVVTSLSKKTTPARELYEKVYCARGEMENRIKEQQMDLFADRTSAATMQANQLRLWLSTAAYLLIVELRRLALAGTELEKAQSGTIRLKLFKIGARIRLSARRIYLQLSSACPYRELFVLVARRLQTLSAAGP